MVEGVFACLTGFSKGGEGGFDCGCEGRSATPDSTERVFSSPAGLAVAPLAPDVVLVRREGGMAEGVAGREGESGDATLCFCGVLGLSIVVVCC